MVGQTWASVSVFQGGEYQYDVSSIVLRTQSYDYGVATTLRNNEVGPPLDALPRTAQRGSFFAFADGFFVTNKAGKGLGNPFKDRSAKEIDQMFKDKGFRESGLDARNGKGGYVNPKTGRSYHIDPKEYGKYREPNHVDVNRPRGYKGAVDKKKLPYKE